MIFSLDVFNTNNLQASCQALTDAGKMIYAPDIAVSKDPIFNRDYCEILIIYLTIL